MNAGDVVCLESELSLTDDFLFLKDGLMPYLELLIWLKSLAEMKTGDRRA